MAFSRFTTWRTRGGHVLVESERLQLGEQDEQRRSEAARRSLPLAQVLWNIRCNDLTAQHGDFTGEQRKSFCTNLASDVAALVAEALERVGRVAVVKATPG